MGAERVCERDKTCCAGAVKIEHAKTIEQELE